jgi:ankyrin repeat protein
VLGANVNYQSKDYRKPLQQAVLYNLPQVCQLLVSFGADVDYTYKIGEYWQNSPLTMAFLMKSYNIIKYLLKPNAKLDVEQADYFDIADKAVQKEDMEMLKLLTRCEDPPIDWICEWICKKISTAIPKHKTYKKLQFLLSLSNTHPTFGETTSGLKHLCRDAIRKNLGQVRTFSKINKLKIPKTVKRYLACDSLLRYICMEKLKNQNQPMKARKKAERLLWQLNHLHQCCGSN